MSIHEEASLRARDIAPATPDQDAPDGDGAADAATSPDESA
jgi:hypothetical protein